MPDYEILELLLALAIPRNDVKPVAKALLDQFGSLGDVLSADPAALTQVRGIGDSAATALKIVRAAGMRLSIQQIANRNVIGSWDQLLAYCTAAMGYQKIEQLRILFLDRKNVLIADEVQQQGTVDHTPLYPREVVKRALELGASAIILVHNHPSGDPTPSRADIEMTRQVKEICENLGIALHDHIVIGRGSHASFQALGLL